MASYVHFGPLFTPSAPPPTGPTQVPTCQECSSNISMLFLLKDLTGLKSSMVQRVHCAPVSPPVDGDRKDTFNLLSYCVH